MRRSARPYRWLWGLTSGLIIVILVLAVPGVPWLADPSIQAAGDPDQPEPARAGSGTAVAHTVFLPLVAREASFQVASSFGIQMYGNLSKPASALDLAQTAGATWVRWPFGWGSIEPRDTTPAYYNWAGTDASFTAAKAAGLSVIATMANSPSWAATYGAGPLDRSGVAPFVEFMTATVERYDGDGEADAPGSPVIDYWEIYNEPDGGDIIRARYGAGFWGHYGAEYAQMLCAVYPAVKAASPNARIVLGGVAHDWFEEDGGPFVRSFLDDVLAAGGGHCLDALAFHYFPPFESVWTPYGPGLSGKANYLRGKLAAYGVGTLPLLVTETGNHSNADPSWPSTPEIQAGYVVKLFTQAITSRIPALIWFSWTDLDGYWAASGLLDYDRQPKLAYHAFKAARRKLGTAVFLRRLSDGETGSPEVEVYQFSGPSSPFYVVWANGADTRQVRLPGKIARISGLVDETLAKVLDTDDGVADGLVTVTAKFDPIYVDVIE